ncbi:MAG: phosphatase PAP2 family protein [bacterium]
MFFSNLFYKFQKSLLRLFTGYYLLIQIIGVLFTAIIVYVDGDYKFYELYKSPNIYYFFFGSVLLGALLPIIVPLILLVFARTRKSLNLKNLAFALGQSAILAWALSSLYKAVTGRTPPPQSFNIFFDLHNTFNFGFFQNGIFWGWPSSHTMIAFAMAFTLITLWPKNKILIISALVYATYIGLGVSVSNIHWVSDAVAGAIMGSVVGISVGKTFLKKI